jgi:preprotein translocase subunit SecE
MSAKDKKRKNKTVKNNAVGEKHAADGSMGHSANSLKWVLAIGLVVAGVFFDQHYWGIISDSMEHGVIVGMMAFIYNFGRVVAWLVLILSAVALLSATDQGRMAWQYLKKARDEMYRVTWPTRQEAMKMTLVLSCIVSVVGLFLFAIDFGFMKIIGMVVH